MITRINLIEKKGFEITYGTFAVAVGGILLASLLLYGSLWLGGIRSTQRIANLQADIERLKKEREQIISQQTAFQGEGPYLKIQTELEQAPEWSAILQNITQALPSRTWLASMNTTRQEGEGNPKGIILNGKAKTSQSVTAFLANLEGEPHFSKVVLTTSDLEASGEFNFTITCDIGSNPWSLKPRPNPENKF